MTKVRGRHPEFRYVTRDLGTQKLLIAALHAVKNAENRELVNEQIAILDHLIQSRRRSLVKTLAADFGLEVPEEWTA